MVLYFVWSPPPPSLVVLMYSRRDAVRSSAISEVSEPWISEP